MVDGIAMGIVWLFQFLGSAGGRSRRVETLPNIHSAGLTECSVVPGSNHLHFESVLCFAQGWLVESKAKQDPERGLSPGRVVVSVVF